MAPAETVIRQAACPEDYQAFADIIAGYVEWRRERYKNDLWLVEAAFGYQALDRELAQLAASYGPPNGKALLALGDGVVQGGVAYRRSRMRRAR